MAAGRATARWDGPEGQELQTQVFARLLSGRPLADLSLPEVDGRVDLRGITAPIPRRLQRFEWRDWFLEELGDLLHFRGVRLDGLDFSGAALQSLRFHDCDIADCTFARARCDDWRLWGSRVSESDFTRASLRGAAVGTWHGNGRNQWQGVDFSNADFRVGVSKQAVYERCDFSNAKLSKVEFLQCAFSDCRFSGDLQGVLFDGRALPESPAPPPMAEVDFVSARFSEVEFRGCVLDGVRLPDDIAIRVIGHFPAVFIEALNLLDDDETPHARALRAVLTNHQKMMRNPTEDYVFNRRDWESWGGEDEAIFVENILAEAEAAAAAVSQHRQGRRKFDQFRRRP